MSFLCTKWMENCEAMTSSPHSFAYSYWLVKKCFLKICETSKCHNFLIFQPIFIRFSLLCLKFFTLSSEIKLNLLWSSSLSSVQSSSYVFNIHWYILTLHSFILYWSSLSQSFEGRLADNKKYSLLNVVYYNFLEQDTGIYLTIISYTLECSYNVNSGKLLWKCIWDYRKLWFVIAVVLEVGVLEM